MTDDLEPTDDELFDPGGAGLVDRFIAEMWDASLENITDTSWLVETDRGTFDVTRLRPVLTALIGGWARSSGRRPADRSGSSTRRPADRSGSSTRRPADRSGRRGGYRSGWRWGRAEDYRIDPGGHLHRRPRPRLYVESPDEFVSIAEPTWDEVGRWHDLPPPKDAE